MNYRIIGIFTVMIVAFTAMAVTAFADEPTEEDSAGGYYLAKYEGSQLAREDIAKVKAGLIVLMDETNAFGCVYETGGDDPHKSGGEVSAHGWWIKKSDKCPSRADVAVWLQTAWCNDFGCQWITISFNKDRIRPGRGRGRRVTARHECHSNEWTFYRNMVAVDIPGVIDPPNRVYKIEQVQCRPPGPSYPG